METLHRNDALIWLIGGLTLFTTTALITTHLDRHRPPDQSLPIDSPHYSPPLTAIQPLTTPSPPSPLTTPPQRQRRQRQSQQQPRIKPPATPEDRIPINTLSALAIHPNHDIRRCATDIARTRFNSSTSARRILQTALHSRDPDTREQAVQTVRFLGGVAKYSFDQTDYTSEGPNADRTPPTLEEVEERAERRAEEDQRNIEYLSRQSMVGAGTRRGWRGESGTVIDQDMIESMLDRRGVDFDELVDRMVAGSNQGVVRAVVTTRDSEDGTVELFMIQREEEVEEENGESSMNENERISRRDGRVMVAEEEMRRRRNREAMALGTDDDGLEIHHMQRRQT